MVTVGIVILIRRMELCYGFLPMAGGSKIGEEAFREKRIYILRKPLIKKMWNQKVKAGTTVGYFSVHRHSFL